MAATVKKQIKLLSSDDGIAATEEIGLMAASQGILIPGALLYLSMSGTWKAADTSDGSDDVVHGVFAGLVNKGSTWPITAQLAASTKILVKRITTRQLFAVYCEDNGTDSAVAQANVGNEYGLRISTTAAQVGYATLDVNNSNDTVVVVDIMSNRESCKYTTSDAPGVAVVRFLAAAIEAEKA